MTDPIHPEGDACNVLARRYVRVLEQRRDGLIAFEFSLGWSELTVELALPATAFAEFCERNQVQRLDR